MRADQLAFFCLLNVLFSGRGFFAVRWKKWLDDPISRCDEFYHDKRYKGFSGFLLHLPLLLHDALCGVFLSAWDLKGSILHGANCNLDTYTHNDGGLPDVYRLEFSYHARRSVDQPEEHTLQHLDRGVRSIL